MSRSHRPRSNRADLLGGHVTRVALVAILLLAIASPGTSRARVTVGGQTSPAPHSASVRPVRPAPQAPRLQEGSTPTPTQDQRLINLEAQLDTAWNAQDWPEALRIINEMIAIDPEYDDIQERRYFAHINYGYDLLTEGRCTESLGEFRTALELRPEGEEALAGLELVGRYCSTPVPSTITATPGPSVFPPLTPTPIGGPTATPQIISSPITYTVQPGDTLFSLSRRYGTTVQAIMQANGMMSYFLRAGDVIWVPASGGPLPGPVVHIVQPGETLYSIARQYNTTVWAIMSANGMSSYTIWAYRALFIPTVMQPGPVVHVVQPGDTLYSIARIYGTTVSLIMMANGLRTYAIYPYQRLVIPPEGWAGWPLYWPDTSPGGWPHYGSVYRVQPGDTLFSIARRFGTTVAQLMAVNGLTSSTIYAGTTLRIPGGA